MLFKLTIIKHTPDERCMTLIDLVLIYVSIYILVLIQTTTKRPDDSYETYEYYDDDLDEDGQSTWVVYMIAIAMGLCCICTVVLAKSRSDNTGRANEGLN